VRALQRLSKTFGEFVLTTNLDGAVRDIWASNTFLDRPPRVLFGENLAEIISGETCLPLRGTLRRVLKTGIAERFEYSGRLRERTRWFVARVIPLSHRGKAPGSLCITCCDVTEGKLAEQNVRKSQTLLAESERLVNNGSWELDFRTGAIAWSDNLYRLHGFAPGEISPSEERCLQMLHPDDRARAKDLLEQSLSSREPAEHQYRVAMKDGSLRTFQTRFAPFFSDSGEPLRIVGSTQDVTDRIFAEEKIRKSEALLAQAEQLANLGSWELDLETNEITWSDQRYRMADMDPRMPAPTLEAHRKLIHPADRDAVYAAMAEAVSSGRPLEYEARFVRASGEIRLMHKRALPIFDATGKTIRLVGMAQDITERRSEEIRLRRSEALLDQAEEIAGFGCWESDLLTGQLILSKQLAKMYGVAPEQQWGPDEYWENVLRNDREQLRQTVRDAVAQCRPFEYITRYRIPDGSARIYHVRGVPVAGGDDSTACVRGVVHDITTQVRNEEDLRRLSQELMRTQDAERRMIARNLHESAGQTLAALKMTLANLEESLGESPSEDARANIHAARGLAEDAIREVRVVSYLMHPPMLDEAGLGPTLVWYARGFSERSGIETTLHVDKNLGRLPQQVETTIFRVVQESLTNVHRYSGSRTAYICLGRGDANSAVSIEIQDHGCGLQPHPPNRSTRLGVGISGMRERVKQLGGMFEIESVAGHGTKVRAVFPNAATDSKPEAITSLDQHSVENTKGG
jgi:PAS domain S-box-containing protein